MRMKDGFVKKILCLFVFVIVLATRANSHGVSFPRITNEKSYIFFNLTSPYLLFLDDVFNELIENNYNVSRQCRNDTHKLLDLASQGNPSALKILDATGKPQSGVLQGGVFFLGFFSECIQTVVKDEFQRNSFRGKYCLVNFNFTEFSGDKIFPQASWAVLTQSKKPPTVGICIPSSCTDRDLQYAVNKGSNEVLGTSVQVSMCHDVQGNISQDSAALTVLCILMIFAAISVCATFYDMCYYNIIKISGRDTSKSASTEVLCEDHVKPTSSFLVKMLMSFSITRNANKILSVSDSGDSVRMLHGLKFISMALIICGHTFSFATQFLFIRNPGAATQAPKDFLSQAFANGTLAVDTFYYISGLLVAYVTLKVMVKTGGKLPLLYFYFHRYFRLTPLMMAVIGFCAVILRYMGSGPNWFPAIQMYDVWCKKNWWINALYLHNFINTDTMCLSHSWYLATDMQFYLIVPLILIPLHRSLKYGLIAMFIFMFSTTLTTGLITFLNKYPAIPYINDAVAIDSLNGYYKDVYIKPYCRIGPYIIGIAVGYYLLQKKVLNLKWPTVVGIWSISVALGLAVIYLMWPANQGDLPNPSEAAAYSSLARIVWAGTLGWLTVACVSGYGGFINTILSWTPFVPLSRLTYCAYLIHPMIMNAYYGSTEMTVDFSYSFMLYLFLGNICVTYVLSFVLSLLFESPFVGLEKVLLSSKNS